MTHGKYEKKPADHRAGEQESAGGISPRRKKKIWQKVLIIVLVFVLVLAALIATAVNYVLGKIGRFEDETTPTGDTASFVDEFETDPPVEGQETLQTVNAGDVTFESVGEIIDENVVNILLVGQDARAGEGRSRSDSMIMVSLNRAKNSIQLTSFMRDTYVQIPGYLNNRLNVPYRYGGPALLNETLKQNFGVIIDGNVEVNFQEFATIIDILGGVDIEMNEEEAANMRSEMGVDHAKAGENHLNGEEALAFCRIRHLSGGDYARTERQRRVLSALMESFKGASVISILGLIEDVLPHVVTNLTNTQIINYATTGLAMLADGAQISSMRIPANDAHYEATIDGMMVLVPNLKMCQDDLIDFIYSTED